MKHSLTSLRRTIIISFGLFVFLLLVAYLCIAHYYKDHFCANTFINGVDCSNLTTEEAKKRITSKVASYTLSINTREGESQRMEGSEISLSCGVEKELVSVLKRQSSLGWFKNVLGGEVLDTPYQVTYDDKRLDARIEALPCLKKEKQIPPVNARISDYDSEKGFTIIKEQPGSRLNKEKLKVEIRSAVRNLNGALSLEDRGCYERAVVTSEDPRLIEALQQVHTYLRTRLTYVVGGSTEYLDEKRIGPAIKVDKQNHVTVDGQMVERFVEELNQRYRKVEQTRTFKTSYGKTIEIKGGDYGTRLDCEKEKEEILSCIRNGEQRRKEPAFLKVGACEEKEAITGSYVEINLAKQQLFVYREGKKVIESPLVSGRMRGGHSTPTGVYELKAKQRSRYLEGPDDDGSRYRSFVNYWMPFNGGIGLHDATWRHGRFGGTIYKVGGSHGCINLPLKKAKEIYEKIEIGMPIVVYELKDTK